MNNNQTPNNQKNDNFADNATNFVNNVADETAQMDPQDIANNKVLSLFSYIGIFVLIPLLAAKDSKYARFHANQGIVLLITELIIGVVNVILAFIPILGPIISWVLSVVTLVFAIMGIVNAVTGKAKELPLIGKIKILNNIYLKVM